MKKMTEEIEIINIDLRENSKLSKNKYPKLKDPLDTAEDWGIDGMLTDGAYSFKPFLLKDDNCIELHMVIFGSQYKLIKKIPCDSTLEDIINERNIMLGVAFDSLYPEFNIETPGDYLKIHIDAVFNNK